MTRLGFIGLGDMGHPMAARLIERGHDVVLWNRTSAKVDDLVSLGATAAASPADLADRCSVIGLCLTSDAAVTEVTCGATGLLAAVSRKPGQVIVDFSTGSPDQARTLAACAGQCGAGWIDAPVSGGVGAAAKGQLIMFLGGDAVDLAAATPLLESLSARRTHMGPVGAGQATKICNQMIVGANLLVIAETIAAARRAGIDVARLPEALRSGFADSTPLQIFGPRMAAHQFSPRLGSLALMEKDLMLACVMAERGNAETPILALCRALYANVHDVAGMSIGEDISTLIRLFEQHDDPASPTPVNRTA